jgi:phosphocarrier protein HPr
VTERFDATFEIVNELGLHARAAAKLVEVAGRFRCVVKLEKEGQTADAKSIMGVLLLCGYKGAKLTVTATGEDAKAAVAAIGALLADRFGEDR